MSSIFHSRVSTRTAGFILVGGWIGYFVICACVCLAFDFPDGSTVGSASAGILLLTFLVMYGNSITAALVMAPKSDFQVSWRQFARISIDFALLPLMAPVLVIPCIYIGGIPISCLTTPWFDERWVMILRIEFSWFVGLIAVPYFPLLWPVLHRARPRTPDGYLFAPKTWMITCAFALFSILLLVAHPPVALWGIACVSWLSFCAVYHWLLIPRFPRYDLTSLSPFSASSNIR